MSLKSVATFGIAVLLVGISVAPASAQADIAGGGYPWSVSQKANAATVNPVAPRRARTNHANRYHRHLTRIGFARARHLSPRPRIHRTASTVRLQARTSRIAVRAHASRFTRQARTNGHRAVRLHAQARNVARINRHSVRMSQRNLARRLGTHPRHAPVAPRGA